VDPEGAAVGSGMPVVTRRFSCPEEVLAGEIDLAVAYLTACNPDIPPSALLIARPLGRRAEFCQMIAAMLAERAERGLSGMAISDPDDAEATRIENRA
jgi:hypothetical protein